MKSERLPFVRQPKLLEQPKLEKPPEVVKVSTPTPPGIVPEKKTDGYRDPAEAPKASEATETSLRPAVRAALASLQSEVETYVPAKSHQRVVQLGAAVESSKPWLMAGATVVVVDPSREALTQAKQRNLRFHHLAEGTLNQPLKDVGVRDSNADLVIATGKLSADLDTSLAAISTALDHGGTFAWTYEGNPKEVEAALSRHGFTVVKHETPKGGSGVGYGEEPQRVLIAKKSGAPEPLPKDLERMDRTSCVDRQAVLKAHGAKLAEGPLSLKVVPGSDPALQAEHQRMIDAIGANLGIDPSAVPLPSRVAKEGTQGAPGCDALVLLAHPDDESGFSGGTLRAAADAGKKIKIASVTGGEGGQSNTGASGKALAESRGRELQHVNDLLGAQGIELMGFSDFGKYTDKQRSIPTTREDSLQKWGFMALVEKMVRSIRENRPRTLLTFDTKHDPDYALHGHHLATGLAATVAFHLAGNPRMFPEQGLKPWTPLRQQVVSSFEREGTRFTKLQIDPERKRKTLEAHGTQIYSLEKMFEAIDRREPYALTETWHLTQSRDGGQLGADPMQRLFG